ncbi:MAG: zinc-binding dehydrogenase [Clostridiaceae bacterium]|jgi:D-arabinose 1-dehydrogenase-like Zn-dependent alcohol dehydrogenase|nr:zinc-binding dehydrogenase [Clostridiaceae bacterium]
MNTMKAAVVTEDGSLEVREIPVPVINEYQVLVKMSFGSTCTGTDQRLMEKKHPYPVFYPSVLGHESVGRAIKLGSKVTTFKTGDLISRVGAPAMPEIGLGICWGGFAQYGVATDHLAMERDGIPRSEWEKARVQKLIPDDIDEKTAPMIITWRETLSYTNRLGIKTGDNVLIAGSGANALAFIRHCVYVGAKVVVLGSTSREELAIRAGAKANIDYKSGNQLQKLKDLFPDGIDYIIDAVGYSENINTALPLIRQNGCVAVYGWHSRKDYAINPFYAANSFRVYCDGYDEPETHDEVIKRIREGFLDASLWYDKDSPVPLEEIASAYAALKERKALKYLIDLS